MKIVGQSTLANGMPYVHLGYFAATYMKPNASLLNGGLAGLCLGLAMALSLVLSKTMAGWTALDFVRRGPKKILLGGVTLMVLGGISIALALAYKKEIVPAPFDRTHSNGYALLKEVALRHEQGQPVPSDLSGLGLPNDNLTDGWLHPMRLVVFDQGAFRTYSILSAGPDGSFDTADDIRMSPETP